MFSQKTVIVEDVIYVPDMSNQHQNNISLNYLCLLVWLFKWFIPLMFFFYYREES